MPPLLMEDTKSPEKHALTRKGALLLTQLVTQTYGAYPFNAPPGLYVEVIT